MTFVAWRRIHRTASGTIGVLGIVHSALTLPIYRSWSAEAVWFLGTGVALISIAVINWAHIGEEPCALPTARAVRWLNWLYVGLAVVAVIAVTEPQAYVLGAALATQAIASHATLVG